MRRSFTVASIVVHAIVVATLCIAQLLAVGSLPEPRMPLSFVGAIPIRVIDIPLPQPQRTVGGPAGNADHTAATPVDAPTQIGPEQPTDGRASDPANAVDSIGVVRGLGSGDVLGTASATPVAPPASAPSAPVRPSAGIRPPRKIVHVDPVYPRVAQQAHIEGTVILETVIDVDGRVTSVRVLRSIPMLDQAAIDAVRGWTFTPTMLNGAPVQVALTVTVQFALSGR